MASPWPSSDIPSLQVKAMRLLGDVLVLRRWADQEHARHYSVSSWVSACLTISSGLEVREAQGLLTDEELDTWMDLYHQARREALAQPARTDGDRAALAILAMADMQRDVVRRDGDLVGMAVLSLAEDLIAKII